MEEVEDISNPPAERKSEAFKGELIKPLSDSVANKCFPVANECENCLKVKNREIELHLNFCATCDNQYKNDVDESPTYIYASCIGGVHRTISDTFGRVSGLAYSRLTPGGIESRKLSEL
ncbi:hypothetical protein NQ317_018346 [Molorchus minor]|uniref:Uncharacterized protein n=1 Tax=Molorchus minor TaxID=1323400 RepID=A0ABQ9IQK6_9CUCU|nr:hypothetical protein NQ317_018346 [Molorchus minor]